MSRFAVAWKAFREAWTGVMSRFASCWHETGAVATIRIPGLVMTDHVEEVGAVEGVHPVSFERQAEVRGQEADLVAVARDG